MRLKLYIKLFILSLIISLIVIIKTHNIDKKISSEDEAIIEMIFDSLEVNKTDIHLNFENQIRFINTVNRIVINTIEPSSFGIPLGQKREPKNIIENKYGQCFDRSRLIEKILIHYGFKTRHLSIYKRDNRTSAIKTIFTPQSPSHATSEVKTLKGWLIIDSNSNWISLSKEKVPLAFKDLSDKKLFFPIDDSLVPYYHNENIGIYGLYSRHGLFYPPFNKIPDFNFRELFYNLGI
jgi:hypothetical protein